MNLLNEPVLQDHRDKVQKRFDIVIKPCHLVAYMFHPKCLGAGLTLEHIETVKEWLICKDEAFLPAAIAFQAEATPFPASFFTARGWASNPVTQWKALGSSSTGLPDGFIDFMVALQSAMSSSAARERVFSSFWAGPHQAPQQARTPESCKVGIHIQDIERTQRAGL